MNNIYKLSSYLLKYEEEYNEYKNIINSLYFPVILKIAQQSQIGLFEDNLNKSDDSNYNFHFDQFKRVIQDPSGENEEFLNLIFEKMQEKFPTIDKKDIFDDIVKDFELDISLYYGLKLYDLDAARKYMKIVPEAFWKPEFKQEKLPFENALNIAPLGISAIDDEKEKANFLEMEEIIKQDERGREILSQKGYIGLDSKAYLLKLLKLDNNYKNIATIGDFLNYINSSKKNVISNTRIEKLENEINNLWIELYDVYKKALEIKKSLVVAEFTPKDKSEIKTLEDSIKYSAVYLNFITNKMFIKNLDLKPFKRNKIIKENKEEYSLEEIKNILENKTYDKNPLSDAVHKIEILKAEIKRYNDILDNVKIYQGLLKNFNKKVSRETQKYINTMFDSEKKDINIVRWTERYRPDIIQKLYEKTIATAASVIEEESIKYKQDESFEFFLMPIELQNILYGGVGQLDSASEIASVAYAQKQWLSYSFKRILIKNIALNLFKECKKLFQEKNFNIGLDIVDNFYSIDIVKDADNVVDLKDLKKFIENWKGNKNIISIFNVLNANLKDNDLSNKLLDNLSKNMKLYAAIDNYNITNFIEDLIDKYLNNPKIKTEEDLTNIFVGDNKYKYLQVMEQGVADNIFSILIGFSQYNNNHDNPLFPILTSYSFKKWLGKPINLTYVESDFYSRVLRDVGYSTSEINNLLKQQYDVRYHTFNAIVNNNKYVFKNNSYKASSLELPILEGMILVDSEGSKYEVINTDLYYKILIIDSNGNVTNTSSYTINTSCSGEPTNFNNFEYAILSPSFNDFLEASKRNEVNKDKDKDKDNNEGAASELTAKGVLNELGFHNNIALNYRDISLITAIAEYSVALYHFSENNITDTILNISKDLYNLNVTREFSSRARMVGYIFGGVGFKDITSGIENLSTNRGFEVSSKKEFVKNIMNYINASFKSSTIDDTTERYVLSFLNILNSNKFENLKLIKNKYNIKDFSQIGYISFVLSNRLFISNDSMKRALKTVRITENMKLEAIVDKVLESAEFIERNQDLKDKHIARITNSPNYNSYTTVSRNYIDNCIKLYKYGGIEAFENPESKAFSLVNKLLDGGILKDADEFKKSIKLLSRLCERKEGIRPNLGNATSKIKLKNLLYEYAQIKDSDETNLSNLIPNFEALNFEEMVDKITLLAENDIVLKLAEEDEHLHTIVMKVLTGVFKSDVEKIRKSSSSEKEYINDLKLKKIIQDGASNLELLQNSELLLTYAIKAKEKDKRLFNFEYTDPNNLFRFRVLKDLDPLHLTIGTQTDCCQHIGHSLGSKSAIDSLINPFAGVLLLEGYIDNSWDILSQSYFHYIPHSNGLILDNVEKSLVNCSRFFSTKNYRLEDLYAEFSIYVKNKYNLGYVRCGKTYNKLSNSSFKNSRLDGRDPRHFEHNKKYTDFEVRSNLDLTKPLFEPKIKFKESNSKNINK